MSCICCLGARSGCSEPDGGGSSSEMSTISMNPRSIIFLVTLAGSYATGLNGPGLWRSAADLDSSS